MKLIETLQMIAEWVMGKGRNLYKPLEVSPEELARKATELRVATEIADGRIEAIRLKYRDMQTGKGKSQ